MFLNVTILPWILNMRIKCKYCMILYMNFYMCERERITISQVTRSLALASWAEILTRYKKFPSFLFHSHIVVHEVLLRWDCLARTHTHSFNRLSHRVLLFAHSASQSYSIALFRHTRLHSDILTFISTPCSLIARLASVCAHSINIIFYKLNLRALNVQVKQL